MVITGYLKTSLIEWPGKIASVIFTQGCNFQCGFCHNRELVGNGFTQIGDGFTRIEERVVLEDLEKRKKWIDAVVITGGEPTLQGDLIEFIKLIKLIKGMKIMVETNGSRPEVVGKLIDGGLVDYWTMDLKSNFESYGGIVGGEGSGKELVSRIKESMGLIAGSGVEYEFRTTVVPGIHTLENLKKLAEEIKEVVGGAEVSEVSKVSKGKSYKYQIPNTQYPVKWFLQQFRPINCLDKSFLKRKPFTEVEMDEFLAEVQKIVPNTYLRGV